MLRNIPTFVLLLLFLWPDSLTAADATIEPTGAVEIVHSGYKFTEGPAWDAKTNTLYFTDIPNKTIHQLTDDGKLSPLTTDSKQANGLLVTADARLLACQMDGQLVAYNPQTAKFTVLASEFEGKRFNAPNDLVIDSIGGIYFTDPLFAAPQPLPQGVQAVYYVTPAGQVSRVTGDVAAPNGIGLSPDGKSLYVAPSHQAEMLVYEVQAPGKLSAAKTFCVVAQPDGKTNTGADGIALDVQGNVYITTDLGVQIFAADASPRGLVKFPEQPANVTFGGKDKKTMYVTARTGLYRVTMPIAGL